MSDQDTCTITATTGHQIRTNSYADHPAGSTFLAAHAPGGALLTAWPATAWSTPAGAQAVLAELGALVTDTTVDDPEYGLERHMPLPDGAVRFCPNGAYVRLLDQDGREVDWGSAYWTFEELAEDPVLVAGAVTGAASLLT